ncbi:MAG TPA: hypothetical protein VFA75_19370 [Nevskia sp.]|jgi:hypothetical protein|nr:hypothetical protein [Nevskia sp.]
MTQQTKQFLKLFLVVIVALHLVVGAVYLVSWLTGRQHPSGSAEAPAKAQQH